MPMEDTKIPLPKFLKLLTDNNVTVSVAMSVASKMYVIGFRGGLHTPLPSKPAIKAIVLQPSCES